MAKVTPQLGDPLLESLTPKLFGELTPEQVDSLPDSVREAMESPQTVGIYTTPERQTSRAKFFRFNFEQGVDLTQPGQQLMVIVPKGEEINLQDVWLGHRKRELYSGLKPGQNFTGHDPNGAYTEVLVFDANTNTWRGWHDPKGYDPVKFAEPRDTVEYEKLSDYSGMLGPVRPVAFSLISRGKGDPKKSVVTEHSLEFMSYPEMSPEVKEAVRVYSPGTSFVDYRHPKGPARLPYYGGGKEHHVKGPDHVSGGAAGYPGAVPLGGAVGVEPFTLTKKVDGQGERLDEQGRLWIKLPPGINLKSLEISAGARWWNKLPDKKLVCIGGRKISAYLVDKDGKRFDHFMKSLNVGPQGVLIGGPTDPEYVTKPGDSICIEGEKHTSYLMGWRILYESVKSGVKKSASQATGKPDQQQSIPGVSTQIKGMVSLNETPELDLVPTGESPGGTQGAMWYLDKKSGDRFIVKTYENAGPKKTERCATEVIANNFYRLMGVSAPESYMYKGNVVSREIKGLEKSSCYPGMPIPAKQAEAGKFFGLDGGGESGVKEDLRNGFIVDAWLANWDIFGLDYDNVLKSSDGRAYRTDAGGAMFFRGMGQHKPQFANEAVTEVDTMRDPKMAREAGFVFKELVADSDLVSQVKKLAQVMTDSVINQVVSSAGIPNAEEIIATLIKRRKWLEEKYLKEMPTAKPSTPVKSYEPKPEVKSEVQKPAKTESPSDSKLQLVSEGKKIGLHGVMHVDSKTGKHYVVKDYEGNVDRCATEYIADRIYKTMSIPVIDASMQHGKFVSRATQGLKSYKSTDGKVVDFFNHPDVVDGFVLDAWLANWDVFGLNFEQIKKSPDGRMVRTSNNGALFYRSMGGARPVFESEKVTEVATMRNPAISNQAGLVYGKLVTDEKVKEQVTKLSKVMDDALITEIVNSSGISNPKKVIQALIKRRDWLEKTYLK